MKTIKSEIEIREIRKGFINLKQKIGSKKLKEKGNEKEIERVERKLTGRNGKKERKKVRKYNTVNFSFQYNQREKLENRYHT